MHVHDHTHGLHCSAHYYVLTELALWAVRAETLKIALTRLLPNVPLRALDTCGAVSDRLRAEHTLIPRVLSGNSKRIVLKAHEQRTMFTEASCIPRARRRGVVRVNVAILTIRITAFACSR